MNKVACLLNSPELGGAERSFITQLSLLSKETEFELYYPRIEGLKASAQLREFTESKLNKDLKSFVYNKTLYRSSRSSKSDAFLGAFSMLLQVFLLKVEGIFKFRTIWSNGNKVFYPVILGALLFRYKGTILWHLRDYPVNGRLNKIIRILVENFASFNLAVIANSDSVAKSFSHVFPKLVVHRAYNPVEEVEEKEIKKSSGIIGFAGMSAPWKGLHELYLWASLFEKDLIEMGVKEISVYGKNIYHTKGEHQSYEEQLKKLSKKFPSQLIVRKGLVSPEEIFNSIDIMLHLSLKEEPFGRVLLESFAHGIPCISTGLGGSCELMENFPELIHYPYDYGGLTKTMAEVLKTPGLLEDIRTRGQKEYKRFQSLAKTDLLLIEKTYFQ